MKLKRVSDLFIPYCEISKVTKYLHKYRKLFKLCYVCDVKTSFQKKRWSVKNNQPMNTLKKLSKMVLLHGKHFILCANSFDCHTIARSRALASTFCLTIFWNFRNYFQNMRPRPQFVAELPTFILILFLSNTNRWYNVR